MLRVVVVYVGVQKEGVTAAVPADLGGANKVGAVGGRRGVPAHRYAPALKRSQPIRR